MTAIIRNTFFSSLLALFVGCASIGLPVPETFNQKLAVSLGAVTAVRESTITLLKAGKISADDAQNVQNQANNLRTGLDIARDIARTDPKAGDAKLTALHSALNALQTYLNTKGSP